MKKSLKGNNIMCFRFTDEVEDMLRGLSKSQGVTMTRILEEAIVKMHTGEKFLNEGEKKA